LWVDLGKPAMYAQELKSILLLIIIATLKHCPGTVTQLLYIRKSAFTGGFLPTLSSHAGPTQILWGHWGALIGWPVVPNRSTRHLFSLWYGEGYCGHLSDPLYIQLGRLCLLASLTHPPSSPPPLYAALVILEDVFKTSLKISQSIQ